jgi:Ca2+-transporting ATPase
VRILIVGNWHTYDIEDVTARLQTDLSNGLSADQAAHRLLEFGANILTAVQPISTWRLFLRQFASPLVLILLGACLVSLVLGDYLETGAIFVVVSLNAVLACIQEYRAEKALAALRSLSTPTVRVRRNGQLQEVDAKHLVPGDLMMLETGNIVQADCRLTNSIHLRMQEAVLTGESEPIDKTCEPLPDAHLPVADRHNMTYMGTVVAYGRGEGVVTATGMHTELGQIAELLSTVQSDTTPLQRRLAQLGRNLSIAVLVLVVIVVALGSLGNGNLRLLFLSAISLAVAAIPEGLPAVVTIALALGAQRMLTRQALIRKLPAVETLGSVNVICSDKTGTLTQNRIRVAVVQTLDQQHHLLSSQQDKLPPRNAPPQPPKALPQDPAIGLLLAGGALCNDAQVEPTTGAWANHPLGEPTECALLVAAQRFGINKAELENAMPRVAELPFDATRKRMTTVHRAPSDAKALVTPLRGTAFETACVGSSQHIAFTKGAFDTLLDLCRFVWQHGRCEPLTAEVRNRLTRANDKLAQSGMRVLAIACRRMDALPDEADAQQLEQDLTFIGITGMIDPPRAGVREAVQTCKEAGIRPLMITGDHPLTAAFIAQQLGISTTDHASLLSGQQLAQLSEREFEQRIEEVTVYARVTPEDKLRIVQALQNRGHIVAMTGDGVNDAPALRRADIGVAMGQTGTEVSKQAADMVLLDDNFLTIVAAVEEGRVIYDNIRKFIKYTLTSNTGEIWVMLLAPLVNMPLPLLPLQILWINLLTDGLPGLALGLEPAEPRIMQRPPTPSKQPIFAQGLGLDILWVGLVMGLVPLMVGYGYWQASNPAWHTMLFTTLTLLQMGNVLALRSRHASLFQIGLWSNKPLVYAVSLTFILQIAVIYTPFLQMVFKTVPLSWQDMTVVLSISTVVFWCVELQKWIQRRRLANRAA